jgi:serine protease
METMQVFDQIPQTSVNGVYQYTFPGVPFGTYHIRAGSDLDMDSVLCELGDACGAFPTLDIVSRHITVDETTQSLTGLDFITDFRVNLTTQQ